MKINAIYSTADMFFRYASNFLYAKECEKCGDEFSSDVDHSMCATCRTLDMFEDSSKTIPVEEVLLKPKKFQLDLFGPSSEIKERRPLSKKEKTVQYNLFNDLGDLFKK